MLIALIERRYDAVVGRRLAFHTAQAPLGAIRDSENTGRSAPRRTGTIFLRLAARNQDTLHFLTTRRPCTDDQAERDGRMLKFAVQRVSSIEGAMDFAHPLIPINRPEKRGWAIIDALTGDPTSLATSLRPVLNQGRQPGQLVRDFPNQQVSDLWAVGLKEGPTDATLRITR